MRKLRPDEVSFHYWTTSDDTQIRGNYVATEDDEQDKKDEDEVIRRLNAGDLNAWCSVWVSCRWMSPRNKMHQIEVCQGACSFSPDETPKQMAQELHLEEAALEALMRHLIELCSEADIVREALKDEHAIG